MTTALPRRSLGGLSVPAIGYGAMVLSPGMYGDIDDDRAHAALRSALDEGATFVDTSDAYGSDGHNELLVGRVLAGRRDEVVVATKFGLNVPAGAAEHRFPVGYAFRELLVNAEPRYVRGYAEASLRRLGVDQIDLYYLHFPDPEVPIEDTVGAMAALVDDGLVTHLGVSNVTADELRRAQDVHPLAAVQVEWSMWRPIDDDLRAAADDLGIGVVAWSPLGGGFLTGSVTAVGDDDFRRNAPRFQGANLAANNDRYAPLGAIADRLGVARGQVALAWLLHQHPAVVPIPGSRTPVHIAENLAAAGIELDGDTLAEIDALLAQMTPAGVALI
jgi:aryl-alcohol dehydrogenase-like predicted oxidoreductase